MYVAWFICIYFDIWINLKMLQIIKLFFDRIHHPPDVSHHPRFFDAQQKSSPKASQWCLAGAVPSLSKMKISKNWAGELKHDETCAIFFRCKMLIWFMMQHFFRQNVIVFCCCKSFVLIPFVTCAAMDFLGSQWQLAISVYITSVKPRHGRSTPRSMSLTLKCFTKSEGKKRMDGWCCKSWKFKMIWPKP